MRIAAIVMASGFSSRMGQNKLLMEYRGKALAEHVLDTVKGIDFDKTVVVTCHEAVAAMVVKKQMTVVINEHPELGQSQSVILGTKAAVGSVGGCMGGSAARSVGGSMADSAARSADGNMADCGSDTPEIDGLMYFTADMPFLKKSTIDALLGKFECCPDAIIRPRYSGKAGSPVIFPSSMAGELCQIQGDNGGREVIARHPESVVYVDISDGKQGVDIDDPQAAAQWLA